MHVSHGEGSYNSHKHAILKQILHVIRKRCLSIIPHLIYNLYLT